MTEPGLDPVEVRLDLALSMAKGQRREAGNLVRTIAQLREDYLDQHAQSEEDTASEHSSN